MRFKNIVWNLLGLSLPLAIAALTVPKLLELIGSERFGFLALAWGLIGYAGALDLGIGRATTQRVSMLRGSDDDQTIPDVVATAIRITIITGLVGMLIILSAAMSGLYRLIHAITVQDGELQLSLMFLSLALPMQAISATYRGVNEAYLNFRGISLLRILLGAANFGLPFLIAQHSNKVHFLVGTLVLSRGLALLIYRYFAHTCMYKAGHIKHGRYSKQLVNQLLKFGGWFSLSSIVSPFLVQADRFFVGAILSASFVTLYVIPYEVVTQTLIIVGAVTSVAFPTISNLIYNEPQQVKAKFHSWLFRITAVMFFLMAVMAYLLPHILRLWVGEHITDVSIQVGQILCIGVFFNSIGSMYFALLHGFGKTKLTAVLHFVELPFFLFILYIFISWYGLIGAAIAWACRMFVDSIILVIMSKSIQSQIFKIK